MHPDKKLNFSLMSVPFLSNKKSERKEKEPASKIDALLVVLVGNVFIKFQ